MEIQLPTKPQAAQDSQLEDAVFEFSFPDDPPGPSTPPNADSSPVLPQANAAISPLSYSPPSPSSDHFILVLESRAVDLVAHWEILSREVKALGEVNSLQLSHWHRRNYEIYEQFTENLRTKAQEMTANPVANTLEMDRGSAQVRRLQHQLVTIWESPPDKDWKKVLEALFSRKKDLKRAKNQSISLEDTMILLKKEVFEAKSAQKAIQKDRFDYIERLNKEAEALSEATNTQLAALLSLSTQAKSTLESFATLCDIEEKAEIALAKTQQRCTVGPTLLRDLKAPSNAEMATIPPPLPLQLEPGALFSLLSPLPAAPMPLSEVLLTAEHVLQAFAEQHHSHSVESTVLRYFSEKYPGSSCLPPLKAFLATIATYEAAYISVLRAAFNLYSPPYTAKTHVLELSKALLSVHTILIRPVEEELWAQTGGLIGTKSLLEAVYSEEGIANKAELVWRCKPEGVEKEIYWRIVLLFSLKIANLDAFSVSKAVFSGSRVRLTIPAVHSLLKTTITAEIMLADPHFEQLLSVSQAENSDTMSQLELHRLLDLGWFYAEIGKSAYSLPFIVYYQALLSPISS